MQGQLQRMDRSLQSVLESRFHGQCRVSRHDGKTLWCLARNASVATQLRFQAPMLVPILRKRLQLPDLETMIIHVEQNHVPQKKTSRQANRPSAQGAACLNAMADALSNDALKKAFKRLAERQEGA